MAADDALSAKLKAIVDRHTCCGLNSRQQPNKIIAHANFRDLIPFFDQRVRSPLKMSNFEMIIVRFANKLFTSINKLYK